MDRRSDPVLKNTRSTGGPQSAPLLVHAAASEHVSNRAPVPRSAPGLSRKKPDERGEGGYRKYKVLGPYEDGEITSCSWFLKD